MANVTYTTTQAVTLGTRSVAYLLLADFFLHADGLNLNVQNINLNPDHTVSLTVDKPIRSDHLDGGILNAPCSRWGLGAGA